MTKRLSKEQIRHKRRDLKKWRSVEEMESYLQEINSLLDSESFFNQAGLEFLRDAHVAVRFARLRAARAVRLIPENNPDFEVPFEDGIERYEVVEADLPDRSRGDEYKKKQISDERQGFHARARHDEEADWHKRAALIPVALKKVVGKKAAKPYPACTNLVIYLNINEWGVSQSRTAKSFPSITAPALERFGMVWVLWKEVLYGPWSKV